MTFGRAASGPVDLLTTARLVLHPLAVGDADDMVDVLAHPDLYTFTGGEPPDRPALAQRYRLQIAGPPDRSETWLNWIVRTHDDATAVGFVQASVSDEAADLAWLIGVDHQSNGFAVEAARAMCAWLAATGVRRFDAHIHPDHAASQRVAAALGLTPTGAVDDDGEQIWSAAATD